VTAPTAAPAPRGAPRRTATPPCRPCAQRRTTGKCRDLCRKRRPRRRPRSRRSARVQRHTPAPRFRLGARPGTRPHRSGAAGAYGRRHAEGRPRRSRPCQQQRRQFASPCDHGALPEVRGAQRRSRQVLQPVRGGTVATRRPHWVAPPPAAARAGGNWSGREDLNL
jgi:hypothetical protein